MAAGRIVIQNCMPALDLNGNPVSGARMAFYVNETTDLASVYTTADLNVAHTNPVVADAAGQFPSIFADQDETYSVSIEDSAGNPIGGLRNRDNVKASIYFGDDVLVETLAARDEAVEATMSKADKAGDTFTGQVSFGGASGGLVVKSRTAAGTEYAIYDPAGDGLKIYSSTAAGDLLLLNDFSLTVKGGDHQFLVSKGKQSATLRLHDESGAADRKIYDVITDGGRVEERLLNDGETIKHTVRTIDEDGNTRIGEVPSAGTPTTSTTPRLVVEKFTSANATSGEDPTVSVITRFYGSGADNTRAQGFVSRVYDYGGGNAGTGPSSHSEAGKFEDIAMVALSSPYGVVAGAGGGAGIQMRFAVGAELFVNNQYANQPASESFNKNRAQACLVLTSGVGATTPFAPDAYILFNPFSQVSPRAGIQVPLDSLTTKIMHVAASISEGFDFTQATVSWTVLKVANNQTIIRAKNAAGSADLKLAALSTSDRFELGEQAVSVDLMPSGGPSLRVNAVGAEPRRYTQGALPLASTAPQGTVVTCTNTSKGQVPVFSNGSSAWLFADGTTI